MTGPSEPRGGSQAPRDGGGEEAFPAAYSAAYDGGVCVPTPASESRAVSESVPVYPLQSNDTVMMEGDMWSAKSSSMI